MVLNAIIESLKLSPFFLCYPYQWSEGEKMRRRRLILFGLVLLLTLMMRETSFSMRPTYKHIPSFRVVKGLPETMAAGSTYETELRFMNPRSQTFWMSITLEIASEDSAIDFGDFYLEGTLCSYDAPPKEPNSLDISFTEVSEGNFQFEDWIDERFNHLILTISLSSSLMPGTYTFTLTVTLQYEE